MRYVNYVVQHKFSFKNWITFFVVVFSLRCVVVAKSVCSALHKQSFMFNACAFKCHKRTRDKALHIICFPKPINIDFLGERALSVITRKSSSNVCTNICIIAHSAHLYTKHTFRRWKLAPNCGNIRNFYHLRVGHIEKSRWFSRAPGAPR